MPRRLPRRLERAAYRAQQISILVQCTVLQETARRLFRIRGPRIDPGVLDLLRRRYRQLLERDLRNVEEGLYPRELLFQIPFADYARALPALLRDAPQVVRRMRERDYQDLPDDVDARRFPPYYRRTFHWQTDGYLSRHSAELYDVGVELLFRGTADIMRRQVIPPVTRFLGRIESDWRACLLDVGCGTARTLKQMATAHPELRYYGVDLSPYYIEVARDVLADVPDASLVCENAESLPFVDDHFDVVTSVYLFHELPRNARRNVVAEMFRVLRPGGLLVVEDSAQLSDSPEIAGVLDGFPEQYHEPFYRDYMADDLAALLAEQGFEVDSTEPQLVAKVVAARKPA